VTSAPDPIRTLSSGFPELDRILGGGYAVGRIVELLAREEDRGVLHALAFSAIREQQQRHEGTRLPSCVFIDVGGRVDVPSVAKTQGVDLGCLLYAAPPLEEALAAAEHYVRRRGPTMDLVILNGINDSTDIDEQRRVSSALRVICAAAYRAECAVLVLTESRPAGAAAAIKYYATQRADFFRCDTFIRARAVKNKIAVPFQTCELPLPLAPQPDAPWGI
jgi:RecA/RadA recombinase